MCSESIKQRIADLRDSAKRLRQAAEYAERNVDRNHDRDRAAAMDQQARELEQQFNSEVAE